MLPSALSRNSDHGAHATRLPTMTLRPRHALASALVISLLLHLVVLGGGQLTLPDWFTPEDEVLSRKEANEVPVVSVSFQSPPPVAAPKPKAGVAMVSLPDPSRPKPKPAETKAQPEAEPVPEPEPLPDETPAEEAAVATPEPVVVEPPPAFPVELRAVYRGSYFGLSVEIHQLWRMEGFRYVIENRGSKFGFRASISSEGAITPEGLQPELYRMLINDQVKNAAQFDHTTNKLTFGSPNKPKEVALQAYAQDMASLPFHVALSFRGNEARDVQVTTGNSVYLINLQLEAEEMLKLPAGTIRTLHLRGDREHDDGEVQAGYDVWLAPDYRNFPVKFRGPDGKGRIMELSLKALEFEGKPILGKEIEDSPPPEDHDTLPPELQHHAP